MPVTRVAAASFVPPPEPSRTRTAVRPGPTFGEVLRSGLGVVLSGAAAAASLGGPLLANAVRLPAAVAGRALAGGAAGTAAGGAGTTATATGAGAAAGGDGDLMQQMRELQQQSRDLNLEMLALQEQVQQENRRFTTASNVLKARHDTAKAAIGNIRP